MFPNFEGHVPRLLSPSPMPMFWCVLSFKIQIWRWWIWYFYYFYNAYLVTFTKLAVPVGSYAVKIHRHISWDLQLPSIGCTSTAGYFQDSEHGRCQPTMGSSSSPSIPLSFPLPLPPTSPFLRSRAPPSSSLLFSHLPSHPFALPCSH